MSENYTYPAIIDDSEEGFINVSFPDFPDAFTCVEAGEDFVAEAQDVLALAIRDRLDRREPLPARDRLPQLQAHEKLVYINIWLPYHLRRIQEVYVKKTLTIPSWLDTLAKANHLNFSAVLTQGLKEKLGIRQDASASSPSDSL